MLHTILYNTFHGTIPIDVCNYISSYTTQEISYLPKDIHSKIIQYIPYHIKYYLDRSYFRRFHKDVTFSPYEGYIRSIIRTNNTFILKELLLSNCNKWKQKKKYFYKKIRCDSFISLLNMWSIEYKSNSCRELLNEFMES
jgi:hypothetical protein